MQIFYVPKSKKNDNLGKNITSKPPSWGQGLTKKIYNRKWKSLSRNQLQRNSVN